MTTRASWGTRAGFIFAVAGSAVGLANIWRFPYMVGKNGGGAFIVLYLLSLVLIGFPVFMSEMIIGRSTQTSPSGAFRKLGGNGLWSWGGKLTILTGFIVSSFYSAVAGWILGYLVEAFSGNITSFVDHGEPAAHYASLMDNPLWGLSFHFLFLSICTVVLYFGVRHGIERGNKVMMPLLFAVLIFLVIKGVLLPHASEGLRFLFSPDWSVITPTVVITALGQSFFTMSLGQGTMVTYGSYLNKEENLVKSCIPAVLMDTFVSLLAAVAVFTIVFSAGMQPDAGPGLIFQTLPWVFSHTPGGHLMAILFFSLVALAAITSEISAMEPTIAYLIDEWGWRRHKAVVACGIGAFLLGVPSALSYSLLKGTTITGLSFLDFFDFLASSILIPVGGFLAVILIGWRWGVPRALTHLKQGASGLFERNPWLATYFWFCFKYSAPFLMVVVFLYALGFFPGEF